MKTKRTLKIITFVFIIVLILLNTVIPIHLCASTELKQAEDQMLDLEKVARLKVIDSLDQETRDQIDKEEFNEYVDKILNSILGQEGSKPSIALSKDEYEEWVRNTAIPNYLKYYKEFNKNEGSRYNSISDKRKAFFEYTQKEAVKDKNTAKGETDATKIEDRDNLTVSEEREVEQEITEVTGQNGMLATELTEEERKRADEILKIEDHSWWQDMLGWVENIFNWVRDLPERAAGAIVDFTCAIGDSIINTMQGIMLPGSPKAVAERRPTILFKKILQDRAKDEDYKYDAFIYAFVKKERRNIPLW